MDDFDRRLFEELHRDGRASMQELSSAVGLSRVATRSRVLRLLDSGVIRVTGIVHPASQGLSAFAHLTISVTGPAREAASALASLDEVLLVSIVAGQAAIIAEVITTDARELQGLIRAITAMPHVTNVNTSIYTERVKDLFAPTETLVPVRIDDLDREIVNVLESDGRATYSEMSRITGIPASTVRTRVNHLISRGVLRVCAVVTSEFLGPRHMFGFGVRFDANAEEGTVEAIQNIDAVSYLSLSLGRWNAIGTLLAESQTDVVSQLDKVRAVTGVCELSSWAHLEVVKENYEYSAYKSSVIGPVPSSGAPTPALARR